MNNSRILIVEDEEMTRNLCERSLLDEQYSVDSASTGETALKILQKSNFDLVLSDLMMPGPVNGEKLLEEIKENWPSTDVVIMTAFPTLETAIPILKKGARDYLIKPVNPQFLKSTVTRILERRHLENELNREKFLRQELEASYSELQKLERLKESLLGRLSHELKTPLTKSMMAFKFIESNMVQSQNKKFYNILHCSLKRIKEISEDILLFSNMQEKDFALSKTSTDLKVVLKKIVKKCGLLLDEKSISVQISFEKNVQPIPVDPNLIEVAFKHLILNAIQFNRKGGKIVVDGRKENQKIKITFSDTGIGIPANKIDNIFDSFYQVAEYLTRRVDGLGLGLAIVRRIIEAHGGQIKVQSNPGEGSSFIVSLPLTIYQRSLVNE